MYIQINELSNGEKEKEIPNRYNLRSKNNEEKTDDFNQPAQKENSTKVVIVSSKEKTLKVPKFWSESYP